MVNGAADAVIAAGYSIQQNTHRGKTSGSLDIVGVALAINTLRIATQNMQAQFDQYQKVFDEVG